MTPQEFREASSWLHVASLNGIANSGYECSRVLELARKLAKFANDVEESLRNAKECNTAGGEKPIPPR